MNKYLWSFDVCAEGWGNDTFDTIDECIAAAKDENVDGEYEVVFVGESAAFTPSVDSESVLDQIEEEAEEFVGQVGHDWDAYDRRKRVQLDELDEKLTAVVCEWLKKYDYYPNIWRVEDIKCYPIT